MCIRDRLGSISAASLSKRHDAASIAKLDQVLETLAAQIEIDVDLAARHPGVSAIGLQRLLEAFRRYAGDVENLLPAEVQVQIWLSWLEQEGVLRDRGPSGTLVCRTGGRSRAVLLFRDLRAEDFLLLHPTCSDYEFVEETAPAIAAPAGEAPAGEAPSGEAPAGEAPAVEAPSVETPSTDSGGESPAEPRARILPAGWDSSLAGFLRSGKPEA